MTRGKCLHVTANDSWELTAGDVFVIGGPGEDEYRDLVDLRLINILYQPNQLKMGLMDLPSVAGYHALFTLEPSWRTRQPTQGKLHLNNKELAQVIELADRLETELKAREPGFGFMATAAFMQIIGWLSRCYGRSPSPDGRALLRIGEAMSHLEAQHPPRGQPPFLRPPVRTIGSFRGLPHKANSLQSIGGGNFFWDAPMRFMASWVYRRSRIRRL